jgi:hypothetical protein
MLTVHENKKYSIFIFLAIEAIRVIFIIDYMHKSKGDLCCITHNLFRELSVLATHTVTFLETLVHQSSCFVETSYSHASPTKPAKYYTAGIASEARN